MSLCLYYDCFSGISGDMNLGALMDLGVDPEYLRAELAKLPLSGYRLDIRRESRGGISGTRVEVVTRAEQPHRHLAKILELIEGSGLSSPVRELGGRIFRRLAEAEGRVHGIAPEAVHFHEVGATDAIVDILGAVIAIDSLGVRSILSSSIELGSGVARCEHGLLPVPAPATLELLRGAPTRRGGQPFEATTPTGAAILTSLVDTFDDQPRLIPERIGYGIGAKAGPLPNALRLILGERPSQTARERLSLLECQLDDMNPEWYQYALERLFAAGARDAWLTPLIMKKGRPGTAIGVLCDDHLASPLTELLLRETSTLGVRRQEVEREVLERRIIEVSTRFGPVPVKLAYLQGRRLKAKPEYEVCQRLAQANSVPLQEIYTEVYRHVPSDE